jgi:hypothetical protein
MDKLYYLETQPLAPVLEWSRLALVKEWIEGMDGTVAVESVVGEGSCFRIHLPKAAAKSDSKISQRPDDQETLAESKCEGL